MASFFIVPEQEICNGCKEGQWLSANHHDGAFVFIGLHGPIDLEQAGMSTGVVQAVEGINQIRHAEKPVPGSGAQERCWQECSR